MGDTKYVHFLSFPSNVSTVAFQAHNLFKTKQYREKLAKEHSLLDAEHQNIKHVLSISRELNGIRDVDKLLDLILEKAIAVTNSDAGSIYVVEEADELSSGPGSLVFKVCRNNSVELNLAEFKMPISDQSIVGNCVLHKKSINIPDLYKLDSDPQKNPFNAKHDDSWA